jgi:hypothetical protein
VLFAASPSESIDTRSGAGLVSPWSGFDPQANAVTAYFSKDMTPTPTVMDGGVKSPKIDVDSEIDLSNGLGADNTFYLHFRTWATDPAHSRKIGGTEVRLEFDLAVCRPCPKGGRCVGLTGEGPVASVTNSSAEAQGDTAKIISPLGAPIFVWTQMVYIDPPAKGFDMGYIKMQAIGPGQCVVKAELSAFFECCGTTWMPAPDGNPIIGWGGRTEEPKIPVAANKLVNCPPGGCLPSSSSAAPAPRFEVLGVIGGREILKKSKKCNTWWKKKVKNARKLKKKCTAK